MVKDIWSFIKWQVSRFKFDDYLWFIGFGLIGAGIADNKDLIYIGIFVVSTGMICSMVKSQWSRWKEERRELIEKIKGAK